MINQERKYHLFWYHVTYSIHATSTWSPEGVRSAVANDSYYKLHFKELKLEKRGRLLGTLHMANQCQASRRNCVDLNVKWSVLYLFLCMCCAWNHICLVITWEISACLFQESWKTVMLDNNQPWGENIKPCSVFHLATFSIALILLCQRSKIFVVCMLVDAYKLNIWYVCAPLFLVSTFHWCVMFNGCYCIAGGYVDCVLSFSRVRVELDVRDYWWFKMKFKVTVHPKLIWYYLLILMLSKS